MKKLLLRISLFLCGICVGQPTPPTELIKIPTPPKEKQHKNSLLQLSVNYGVAETLGGELLIQHKKTIVGFGYGGYIGNNSAYLSLTDNHYNMRNEYMYLTYARIHNRWVYGMKVGKQNNANWNKKVLGYNTSGNPMSYTFEKNVDSYTTMVGVYAGYFVTSNFRLNVGVDSFSTATLGFSVGF
jgi:hypothetical protein